MLLIFLNNSKISAFAMTLFEKIKNALTMH